LALGGPRGQPKGSGRIFQSQPREKTQVHQPGGVGVLCGKLGERFIQLDELFVIGVQCDFELVEIDAVTFTASFDTLLVAGAVEENAPHRFGRRGVKVRLKDLETFRAFLRALTMAGVTLISFDPTERARVCSLAAIRKSVKD
jgi:hypothetical protein